MNVAFDPWIPIVTQSGKRELTSLHTALTHGEDIVDVAVRPYERVSLMRLFLSVAHAALEGPKDAVEWCDVSKRLPDRADKYLTSWKDSFELFHTENPWLQVAGLTKVGGDSDSEGDTEPWTPVSKLNLSLATGNASTLFDHQGMIADRSIPIHEIPLSLLTFQCFSPGGLISQVYWNSIQTGKTAKDSPCIPSSMIHALLRGNNLLQTIQLNLPTYEDIRFSYIDNAIGKPVWEMMPTSFSDTTSISNATRSYLGRLVPLTRLVWLDHSGRKMMLGDGLVYPTYSDGFPPEPTATVVLRKNKKEHIRTLLPYRPQKGIWRELGAIVVKRNASGMGGPLSLRNMTQEAESYDIVVAALARDKASIIDAIESVFHISRNFRSNEGTAIYESEVREAELIEGRLRWAIETYRSVIDNGWEGKLRSAGAKKGELKVRLASRATIQYWTTVEKSLSLLMAYIEAIGTEKVMSLRKIWRSMLFKAAIDAYSIACGQDTPRQIKAYAKGWQKLTLKRDSAEPEPIEIKEETV